MHGVFTCFAIRITVGFNSLILHHLLLLERNLHTMTVNQKVYVFHHNRWVLGILAFQIDDNYWFVDVFDIRIRFHINNIRAE